MAHLGEKNQKNKKPTPILMKFVFVFRIAARSPCGKAGEKMDNRFRWGISTSSYPWVLQFTGCWRRDAIKFAPLEGGPPEAVLKAAMNKTHFKEPARITKS